MNVFSLSVVLFLIMDPFGNIASLLKTLHNIPAERRPWIILREMSFAFITMVIFYLLGESIFELLELTPLTVYISSGVILFLTAIKILFPTTDSPRARITNEEPYVIPIAIPLIAGPSLLATIMLFALSNDITATEMWLSMLFAWIASLVVLLLGEKLFKLVGNNGLVALEKLMGMILVMLAIQRFAEGIQQFVACVNC